MVFKKMRKWCKIQMLKKDSCKERKKKIVTNLETRKI